MNPGVELKPTSTSGISRAVVIDVTRRSDLTWDRYARLHRTAESIRQVVQKSEVILDVGGYDGALALFLPEHHIDVLDPITTGGTALSITAEPYEAVVSIDALEHVPPENRDTFLIQLSKLGRRACFINFPSAATANAQKLIFDLTGNPLIQEHVAWPLPSLVYVKKFLESAGFSVHVLQHTSLAQWISQYLLQTAAPDLASEANRYLIQNHLDDPSGTPLYDLLIGTKIG
ncbi:hypothetical protein KF728_15140 [Candidatus Obscuribacterales bacterium]|nr:hypothetical protein [Candidatus Obscuribacterales bacterium]